MNATNEALTDERIAALVRCMRSTYPGASTRRSASSTAFAAVSVAPTAWHTISRMRVELDGAGWHLRAALAALGRWFVHVV